MLSNFLHVVFLTFLTLSCFSQEKSRGFTLIGIVDEKHIDDIKILILNYKNSFGHEVIDTIHLEKNTFLLKGNINSATMATLFKDSISSVWDSPNSVHLFLEPTDISIFITGNHMNDSRIIGSYTQNEFENLEKITNPINSFLDSLILKRNKLIQLNKDNSPSSTLMKQIDNIDSIQEDKLKEIMKIHLGFIKNNSNSYLSAYWLLFYFNKISLPSMEDFYNNLSLEIRESDYGLELLKKIKISKRIKTYRIGDEAYNFQMLDINGNNISLKTLAGKNVLLIFWASWCQPCREKHPYLKKIYRIYQSLGFEIIGISLDKNKEDWLKAIQNDDLPWIQLCDFNGFLSEVIQQYNIKYIPEYFLIDADRIIISKETKIEQLESKLKNIFKQNL